jgi:hypothetical protein
MQFLRMAEQPSAIAKTTPASEMLCEHVHPESEEPQNL